MNLQASDTDLVFVNKYGTVLVMPEVELSQWAELQAEADYEADAPESAATGAMFAMCLGLSFWLGILYWWLK